MPVQFHNTELYDIVIISIEYGYHGKILYKLKTNCNKNT